jgi:excisionase family DNA binding protein
MADVLLSVTQAAKEIGVNRARVLVFIEEKRLPAQKAGKQYVLKASDVKRFKAVARDPGRPKKRDA